MPTIVLSLKDFEKDGYSQDKLKELMPQVGIEVESVAGDDITISMTPNRADLLDFVGIVRALDDFTGVRVPKEEFYKITNDPALRIIVTKEAKKARPYITGLVAKNVDFSGSRLKAMINFMEKFADAYGRKRRKIAIGMHNLEAIKGDLTYTAAKAGSFVPLNMKANMSFEEIMEQHEKGLAYQNTIPDYGTPKALYPVLRDSEKIIALIPITNSEATRTSETTKDVFIDITGTSQKAIMGAANLLACSFMYAGADVYPIAIEYPAVKKQSPVLRYEEIKVNMGKADRTLGAIVGRHDVIRLANKMGYVAAKYGKSVLFYVPPYRLDVLNYQDIIEDIAIAFGYDKINPLPVVGAADGLSDELADFENRLAVYMVGLGYMEAHNSLLTNERVNFDNMLTKYEAGGYIQTSDAQSSEVTMVRSVVLPGLMKNLSISVNERLPQRLFEIGQVFTVNGGKIRESLGIAGASEHARANFSEIKSAVESLLGNIGVEGYKIEPHSNPSYIEGRCAAVKAENEIVCVFGELHPQVLENFGLEEPVVAFEMVLVKSMKYLGL